MVLVRTPEVSSPRLLRVAGAGVLSLLLALVGCTTTPFAHTNPYDPDTPVTLTLIALRDSLFQVGDEVLFQLVTEPAVALGSRGWSVDRTDLVTSLGEGRFRVIALPLVNSTVTVVAQLGLRADTATVVVVAP